MTRDALLYLLEARVDSFSSAERTQTIELRPLPIHCRLPGSEDGGVAGWVSGSFDCRDAQGITVSATTVVLPPSELVQAEPARAFRLDDPARAQGWAYLYGSQGPHADAWLQAFLGDLRHDDSLDLAGINDARGRTQIAGDTRGSRKPAFIRLAATAGHPTLQVRHAELGRMRRPYTLVQISSPPEMWNSAGSAVTAAARSAAGKNEFATDVVRSHIESWWREGPRP